MRLTKKARKRRQRRQISMEITITQPSTIVVDVLVDYKQYKQLRSRTFDPKFSFDDIYASVKPEIVWSAKKIKKIGEKNVNCFISNL